MTLPWPTVSRFHRENLFDVRIGHVPTAGIKSAEAIDGVPCAEMI